MYYLSDVVLIHANTISCFSRMSIFFYRGDSLSSMQRKFQNFWEYPECKTIIIGAYPKSVRGNPNPLGKWLAKYPTLRWDCTFSIVKTQGFPSCISQSQNRYGNPKRLLHLTFIQVYFVFRFNFCGRINLFSHKCFHISCVKG